MPGKTVPDFSLASTDGTTFSPQRPRGKKLVLYFYPRDNTSGCTQQGSDFRERDEDFQRAGCRIGPRGDGVRPFGVMKLKNLYGKKVRGIERSTFAVDQAGVLRRDGAGSRCRATSRRY